LARPMAIAEVRGEPAIFAPSPRWVASFFTSTFTPHPMSRAVDVSTTHVFGDEALSPVEGRVERVIEVEAGPGPFSRSDFAIVVRLGGGLWAKLLHVEPRVRVNERVSVGDPIGRYLRSNFLLEKNLPHVHVEVSRSPKLRPGLSLSIEPSRELVECLKSATVIPGNYARFRVAAVGDSYTLLEPVEAKALAIGGFASGVRVAINGEIGFGHPYVGLIHLGSKPKPNSLVKAFGQPLGYVRRVGRRHSIAINSLESFEKWLQVVSSLANMGRQPRHPNPRFSPTPLCRGESTTLELLVGTMAIAKLGLREEGSYVEITFSPHPQPQATP